VMRLVTNRFTSSRMSIMLDIWSTVASRLLHPSIHRAVAWAGISKAPSGAEALVAGLPAMTRE
jgi:hypothetical protein